MSETPERTSPDLSALLGSNELSNAVGKLLENPELVSAVASALGKNVSAGTPSAPPRADEAPLGEVSPRDSGDMLAAVMPLLSKLGNAEKSAQMDGDSFKHEQLLRALKPYLSSSRGEAIDYIIRISRMSNIIKHMR